MNRPPPSEPASTRVRRGRLPVRELHSGTADAMETLKTAAAPALEMALTAAEASLGPQASTYIAAAGAIVATTAFLVCCRSTWPNGSSTAKSKRSAGKTSDPGVNGKKKKKGLPRVRFCRFCDVEIVSKAFMETHLKGKRHKKLSDGATPEECWVWVEKAPAPSAEEAAETAAAAAAAAAAAKAEAARDAMLASGDSSSWVTVDAVSKKRAARAAAAARRQTAASNAEEEARQRLADEAAARHRLRVYKRCDECGAKARDGAIIEADPDVDGRAYCSVCWERYLDPEGVKERERKAKEVNEHQASRRHVTKWNRD